MIVQIIQVILLFVIPYLIIRFKDFFLTRIFGTIGMAYFFGLVIAAFILVINTLGIDFKLNSDTGETTVAIWLKPKRSQETFKNGSIIICCFDSSSNNSSHNYILCIWKNIT